MTIRFFLILIEFQKNIKEKKKKNSKKIRLTKHPPKRKFPNLEHTKTNFNETKGILG
jgi:hypothetical protein